MVNFLFLIGLELKLIDEIYKLKEELLMLKLMYGIPPYNNTQKILQKLEEEKEKLRKQRFDRVIDIRTKKKLKLKKMTDRELIESIYENLFY